ncbi:scaffold attachment factor B2-like [Argiope bruennichi]|uniref:Scaffold attachment factor B2 like protein n=1 Tax=Argiope bruennichi TaxID=94029 RepID=A0A8T0G763_ARGBR|nr:scaffold attachment factor B2-like [Argiope bruennichi]KAF8797093.1 Scaffold attachment factor B2 like protein [Argiope bruennichi]
MAAASVEDSEPGEISSEKECDDTTNQVNENDIKVKLSELKVADLRVELEKRDLDKSGVKSVLIERLKTALLEEGKDIDECIFKISSESTNTKNFLKKDKIPDSETNGDMEIYNVVEEQKSEDYKDSDSALEDKTSNEVTLQISIDEEEAQLNDDENLEINKGSDIEIDKVVEEPSQSKFESNERKNKLPKSEELPVVETTPSRASKVISEELKEKKSIKTPQLKGETVTSVSPKVLKVIGKNDKIKSANVLAKSLWVTGLPNTTRAADLKALFSKHGKVSSVKIVKSTKLTPVKCYAFVTMATSKDATKAIQNLHRIEFNGRIISVERTQSEPSALLKKTESKVISLATKKPAAKKDISKTTESTKPAPESKSSTKPEVKTNESKPSAEPVKPKESKIKNTEKAKSKEKEPKSKEYKGRDVRRPLIKRTHPMYKSKSFTFNDRQRYPTFKRPFGPRPFIGRSGFGASNFRPRSDASLYEKMREERIRRERYRERERREADRRREYIERKQREEAYRLEREKEKLRIEREMLEREKAEILKLEREKQRLERERLEREKEELRRQAELRRGVKRPYVRVPREVNAYWEDRKKVPRYEERSSFHGEKIRMEPSSSSKYEYLPRERPSMNRHEYDRHSERFSSSKTLHTTPRSDFGDRDSRREVTIRSREENPVYDRNEFRDRDSRRSFPPRERHSSRRESSREEWKHDRRVHERIVSPSTSSGQRRMTYY